MRHIKIRNLKFYFLMSLASLCIYCRTGLFEDAYYAVKHLLCIQMSEKCNMKSTKDLVVWVGARGEAPCSEEDSELWGGTAALA